MENGFQKRILHHTVGAEDPIEAEAVHVLADWGQAQMDGGCQVGGDTQPLPALDTDPGPGGGVWNGWDKLTTW